MHTFVLPPLLILMVSVLGSCVCIIIAAFCRQISLLFQNIREPYHDPKFTSCVHWMELSTISFDNYWVRTEDMTALLLYSIHL